MLLGLVLYALFLMVTRFNLFIVMNDLEENGFIVHDKDYVPKLNKFEGQYYPLMWVDNDNLIIFKIDPVKQKRKYSNGYMVRDAKGYLYKLNIVNKDIQRIYDNTLRFNYCTDGDYVYVKKDRIDQKPNGFRHTVKISKSGEVSEAEEFLHESGWVFSQDEGFICNGNLHHRGYSPHLSISSTAEHNKFIKTDGNYFIVPSFNGNKLKHPVLPRRETDTNSFKYVVQNKNGKEVFNRYVEQPIWANLTSWDCFGACTKSSHVSLVNSGLVFNVTSNSLGSEDKKGISGVYYMGFYDNTQKLLVKGHRFWNLIISDDGCSIAFKGYKNKGYSHSEVLRNAMDNLFYFNVCTK
ncbi:MAG: hypothetical protein CMF61_02525 [Magnetococcales bacterium]|nr:hypothetical protein [Magnetococcales bacterium]|tara:strand:- start:367 stop:1419 length:1053 start_codon:yes stop_codon:yes gene_type:complete